MPTINRPRSKSAPAVLGRNPSFVDRAINKHFVYPSRLAEAINQVNQKDELIKIPVRYRDPNFYMQATDKGFQRLLQILRITKDPKVFKE